MNALDKGARGRPARRDAGIMRRMMMSNYGRRSIAPVAHAIAVLAIALSAAGCVGGPDAGATQTGLLMADPLVLLRPSAWAGAPASCEGLLSGDVEFAVASAEGGLVAAVDDNGEVVCVDTVEAVEEELEQSGRDEEAAALVGAYEATMAARDAALMSRLTPPTHAGDPEPQPNMWRSVREGDPEPQPN